MLTAVVVVSAVAVLASLPFWLPRLVVGLRMAIFARVNGEEGIPIPGELVGVARFREVYAHPAADGRSEGAPLSDLFWYWLAPGPHVHQEHLEPGERYEQAARTTRRILARPKAQCAALAAECAAQVLDATAPGLVRLRDLMMPIWAEFSYRLVFDEPCPRQARDLIVANADDVITALKCCGLRHMDRRGALTDYLRGRLGDVTQPLPTRLSTDEQVFYLQGAFFNTAVVQMSEAMAHLLLAIAQHPDVQRRLAAETGDDAYTDRVIEESLRRYPLFGIAHRITSADIVVDERTTLPAGSVLCFNYPRFHAANFADADRFDPDRWANMTPGETNHIPFGVTGNRPCPARGVAPVAMRAVTREVLRRFTLASSVAHTRSLPSRGPCLLLPRDPAATAGTASDAASITASITGAARYARQRRALLALMRLRDRWEDVGRSLIQLVCGSYMVFDARRLRLAARYFEAAPRDVREATR